MTIEQIRVGYDNFCYIIYCPNTKKSAVVDPGYNASKILDYIIKNDLKLFYIIATHHHGDHTGDIKKIKERFPTAKIIASKYASANYRLKIDRLISDEDIIILGDIKLRFLLTPGHTPDGLCILVDNIAVITGDTLFIGDCGRLDLPGGSFKDMFKSLNEKIKPLDDQIIVYPGHDYGPKPFDTIGNLRPSIEALIKAIKKSLCFFFNHFFFLLKNLKTLYIL